MHGYQFQDPQEVFSAAIANGVLSRDRASARYAGLYMYMHTEADGRVAFKHIETRKYFWTSADIQDSIYQL